MDKNEIDSIATRKVITTASRNIHQAGSIWYAKFFSHLFRMDRARGIPRTIEIRIKTRLSDCKR